MSGLCGWFSREPGALPVLDMAAPLRGVAGEPVRCAAHGLGAVALAGAPGLYHEDDLLIACWGERPDTLARLWRSHGAKACAALSGRFAFALLDERRAEALLAVDRCASRPLYYQMVGRTLLFSSSGEALARHPGAGRDIDPQAIFDYLYLQALPGPRTLHSGQRRLAPGECLHLRSGRAERLRYWRMRFTEHAIDPRPQAALLDALACAVEGEGAPQTAVLLGGGAASVALAGLLQRAGGEPVTTVAVGFEGGPDTLEAARSAARRLGSRHHDIVIGPRDVLDAVPLLAAACDAPCGDPAAVTLLAAARAARAEGALRLAGAQGAAQLFGCGRRLGQLARPGRYERLPGALRQLAIEPLLFNLAARVPGVLARLRARIELSLAPLPARLRRANALSGDGLAAMFEPAFLELVDAQAPAALQEALWWGAPARSAANRQVELELQLDLPGRVLPAFAGACAAAGIEPLHPYLDDAVVAMSARLAPAAKSGPGPRRLFGQALRELAPGCAWHRAAAPLLPLGRWLQLDARLRALACDSLNDLARRRILRRDFLDLLLSRRLPEDPELHARTVWQLMMLEQWFGRQRHDGCAHGTRQDAVAPLVLS
ncbi:asparagine synthase-related protein [Massilia brevitalea]|uniref:asparagine synthase-related protein n=1 Tax=Massilia brevitalea TaxID=442526 RepID=UPI0027396B9E|nr:asparagine synthase-related protein [Massilia brevitalea]